MEAIAVVGGSLAGLRAVEALRAEGFAGRLTWIGAEPHLPYERPPLSKGFLTGERNAADLALKHAPFESLNIEMHLGVRAVGLDLADRTVALDNGDWVGFDGLVVATGATPRRLPDQPPVDGVYVLRTLDDAAVLRTALEGDPHVVIIGGGFIGAEVAASCRARGITRVTVLEGAAVPMERAIGPAIGAELAALHRDHGVDLRCGCGVRKSGKVASMSAAKSII
jgi:3-phenylpropionate/trans-cinnamate dioxygenase ferredoxin reductase subunit